MGGRRKAAMGSLVGDGVVRVGRDLKDKKKIIKRKKEVCAAAQLCWLCCSFNLTVDMASND